MLRCCALKGCMNLNTSTSQLQYCKRLPLGIMQKLMQMATGNCQCSECLVSSATNKVAIEIVKSMICENRRSHKLCVDCVIRFLGDHVIRLLAAVECKGLIEVSEAAGVSSMYFVTTNWPSAGKHSRNSLVKQCRKCNSLTARNFLRNVNNKSEEELIRDYNLLAADHEAYHNDRGNKCY